MSVTKIRKTSSWILLAISAITLIIVALFFLGGEAPEAQRITQIDLQPRFTGLLLNWLYVVAVITTVATIAFSIWNFLNLFKTNRKKALSSLLVFVIFAILLIVTYSIGNGSPLKIVGYEGTQNNAFWLKLADMFFYTMYLLLGLCIVSIIYFSIANRLKK